MKYNLLLFIMLLPSSLMPMQRPTAMDQLLMQIELGDLPQIEKLLKENPTLQSQIRIYRNYATEPVLKFAKRKPHLTPQYMKIARFFVNQGAPIHPQAEQELQAYEQSHRSDTPVSIISPASVKPSPYPVLPVKGVATVSPASGGVVLSEEKYQNLMKAIGNQNAQEVKNLLSAIDPNSVSPTQQENLFVKAQSLFVYIFDYNQLLIAKSILKQLLSKGWNLPSKLKAALDLNLKNQGLGNRSAKIYTPLIGAIKNRNISEVKRLVTQEHVDTNETDSLGTTPLVFAISNPNKEILKILLQNGAQLSDMENYQKAALAKLKVEMNL